MANEEHVELLNQGMEKWNTWKEKNPKIQADLRDIDLNFADLRGFDLRDVYLKGAYLLGTNLSKANLQGADLRKVNLEEADLSRADLSRADLSGADLRNANLNEANLKGADFSGAELSDLNLSGFDLRGARLRGTYLINSILIGASLYRADLRDANLRDADLRGADLSRANLSRADLRGTHLRGTHLRGIHLCETHLRGFELSGFDLSDTNLSRADLSKAQALGTSFKGAIFTGACIEDWNINSSTEFDSAICEYVYLKCDQRERRPREGAFKLGEFATLVQQAADTVDLIFKDGIDWQAFFQSFQDLRNQYSDQDVSIQAIEKKRGGAFVIRLEVPPEVNKAAVEEKAKALYGEQLQQIEGRYQKLLQLQGQQLDDYRAQVQQQQSQNSRLLNIVETMAEKDSASKYDLRGTQFAGGFADTVQGNMEGGTINNAAAETSSLAEATAEIQNLLKQLEASNPAATEADQTAFLNVMIPPTRRERFVGALRAAGGAAIEEVPYGAVLKALVEGWQRPSG
ncbi:MAG: pentapeptide repeat-containing protein [Cyanobacteria bacterium P01_F01_bin.53]